jgi:hypothetical protein
MTGTGDVFAEARQQCAVADVAGVTLVPEGSGERGWCPLCKASKDKKKRDLATGAFQVDATGRRWKCHSCTPRWHDVIDLEHFLRSGPTDTPRHAALRLVGQLPPSTVKAPAPSAAELQAQAAENAARKERSRAFKAAMAVSLWREGLPAAGSPVEAYLRARGIHGVALAAMLSQLRFHPRAYHSGDTARPVVAPAMVGLIMTPDGPTGGVHVTYLSADGAQKADLAPSRKVWGPTSRIDAAGIARPGGVWLTSPLAPGPLIVGEGIETTGAGGAMIGLPCRMVATLSLDALQGAYLTDSRGRVDLSDLQPDPMLPAFTWPEPADQPWGAPILCIDRDMKPIRIRTAGDQDEDDEEILDADGRAVVCAALAAAAWIISGARWLAFAIPPRDMDINDQLMASHSGNAPGYLRLVSLTGFEAACSGDAP